MKIAITLNPEITMGEAKSFYEDFILLCKKHDENILKYETEEFP